MKVKLLDFFRTGHFGEVKLAMSREEVLDILGEPNQIRDTKHDSHWFYGFVSFFFPPQNRPDNGLFWIHCDQLFPPIYDGDGFEIDHSLISNELSLGDAEALFQQENIPYKKTECDAGGNEISIRLTFDSEVNLYFLSRITKSTTFHLTIISKKRKVYNPIPYEERITTFNIVIPQRVYDRLQALGQSRKQSIRTVGSRLLTEYLAKLPEVEVEE